MVELSFEEFKTAAIAALREDQLAYSWVDYKSNAASGTIEPYFLPRDFAGILLWEKTGSIRPARGNPDRAEESMDQEEEKVNYAPLDSILEATVPNITFLTYNRLIRLFEHEQIKQTDGYNYGAIYNIHYLSEQKLWNTLVSKGLILDKQVPSSKMG